MAKLSYDNGKVLGKDLVQITGSFAPNGSSAVDATSRQGRGWSVARTSAGLFTITLSEKYAALVSANATLQLGTGDDKFVQVAAVNVASKTIAIRVWDISGAAETDVAANAANRINFEFVFRTSTRGPLRG